MNAQDKDDFGASEERALDELLARLPAPPKVSTNFTARVMEQVRLEEAAGARKRGWLGWLRLPRLGQIAGAASLAAIFGIAIMQHHRAEMREQMVETLEAVTLAAKKADPSTTKTEAVVTVLTDFEAIRNLPRTASAIDGELLSALAE